MLNTNPVDTLMGSSVKLVAAQGELHSDPRRHIGLVGKLNYLSVTGPDIIYAVSVASQILNTLC